MQAEKKFEKSSTAATAINEGATILNMIELENEIYQLDMNDAYYTVPIKEDITYLQNNDKENDKESDNQESNYDDEVFMSQY